MMTRSELKKDTRKAFKAHLLAVHDAHGELTLDIKADGLKPVMTALRDDFQFEELIDIVGIDYGTYGEAEWQTDEATGTGFSRGVDRSVVQKVIPAEKRFACAYLLLSMTHNLRIRVKVYLDATDPFVDSVVDIYPAANWYEREAFDMYGILFDGHPDLRRILTDYGFIGYPFRKDFPISGHVEMRYDVDAERVVYEPVEIEPRTLVARVIRHEQGE